MRGIVSGVSRKVRSSQTSFSERIMHMPGLVRPVLDERDNLLTFLAQERSALRTSAFGLTDEQARTRPTASTLTIGGLIKHVAFVETNWVNTILERRDSPPDAYLASFDLGVDETLAGALEHYDAVAKRTEATIAEIPDLNQAVPVPKGVPWYPDDVDAWSVRWVLAHLMHETSRHAGHADIIRESLDEIGRAHV